MKIVLQSQGGNYCNGTAYIYVQNEAGQYLVNQYKTVRVDCSSAGRESSANTGWLTFTLS